VLIEADLKEFTKRRVLDRADETARSHISSPFHLRPLRYFIMAILEGFKIRMCGAEPGASPVTGSGSSAGEKSSNAIRRISQFALSRPKWTSRYSNGDFSLWIIHLAQ